MFRRELLRYSGELDSRLADKAARDIKDIEAETKFFVDTKIAPTLDELRARMNAPARPWYKRAIDAVRVVPNVAPAFYTMDPATIIGNILGQYLPQLFTELSAIGEKRENLKKSGLYYLLRLETYQAENRPS